MGLSNWWNRQRSIRKYPSEHAILVASFAGLSKPGHWPHDTTLVAYLADTLKLVDFEAVLGSPDSAVYQSEPPSGAKWANAFWHDEDMAISLIQARDGKRHTLIALREEDRVHCHFNVEGTLVDDMYGNFGSIFA